METKWANVLLNLYCNEDVIADKYGDVVKACKAALGVVDPLSDSNKIVTNLEKFFSLLRKDPSVGTLFKKVKLDPVKTLEKYKQNEKNNAALMIHNTPSSSNDQDGYTESEYEFGQDEDQEDDATPEWSWSTIFSPMFIRAATKKYNDHPEEEAVFRFLDEITESTGQDSKVSELVERIGESIGDKVIASIRPENFAKAIYSQLDGKLNVAHSLVSEIMALRDSIMMGVAQKTEPGKEYKLPMPTLTSSLTNTKAQAPVDDFSDSD